MRKTASLARWRTAFWRRRLRHRKRARLWRPNYRSRGAQPDKWAQAARREESVPAYLPENSTAESARYGEKRGATSHKRVVKAASAFRLETRHGTSEIIRFISEYRDRFTFELICTTLNNNHEGRFITSRGYRQSKARGLSSRPVCDAALVEHSR